MDFDGDTASVFKLHDSNAQQELLDNAFYKDCVQYDHNSQFLSQIKNEAVFAFNVLALTKPDESMFAFDVENISQVEIDYDLILNLNQPIRYKGELYSYGICLLNKWLYNTEPTITAKNNSQDCSQAIFNNSTDNADYHYKLLEFNKNLNWFIAAHRTQTLAFELDESCEVLETCLENPLLKNLPNNPYIGYYIHKSLVDKVHKELPEDLNLVKLLKSKFKKEQFARSVISIGLN